jgi:hypothetical protein
LKLLPLKKVARKLLLSKLLPLPQLLKLLPLLLPLLPLKRVARKLLLRLPPLPQPLQPLLKRVVRKLLLSQLLPLHQRRLPSKLLHQLPLKPVVMKKPMKNNVPE